MYIMYLFYNWFWKYLNIFITLALSVIVMIIIWNPFCIVIFQNLNSVTLLTITISIFSLFIPVISFLNQKKKERELNVADKEFILIQIIAFYKYFNQQYKISNMMTDQVLTPIIKRLLKLNKNIIIDDHDNAFYNRSFNREYREKIINFLIAMKEWKGYSGSEYIGIFKEIQLLSNVAEKGIDILKYAIEDKSVNIELKNNIREIISHKSSSFMPIECMSSIAEHMDHNIMILLGWKPIREYFYVSYKKRYKGKYISEENISNSIVNSFVMKIIIYKRLKQEFMDFKKFTIFLDHYINAIIFEHPSNQGNQVENTTEIGFEFDNGEKYMLKEFDLVI